MPSELKHRLVVRAAVLTAAVAAGVTGLASAQNFAWNAPVSGSWFDPARWTPSGVPDSAAAVANITASGPAYVINVNNSLTLGTLNLASSTATLRFLDGTFNVNNANVASGAIFDFRRGTLAGSGVFNSYGQLNFSADGAVTINRSLTSNNLGRFLTGAAPTLPTTIVNATLTNTDTWTHQWRRVVGNAGRINNSGVYTLDLTRPGFAQTLTWGSGIRFDNSGLLQSAGRDGSVFEGRLNNTGTVRSTTNMRFVGPIDQLFGDTLVGGTWRAENGVIDFNNRPIETLAGNARVELVGPGSRIVGLADLTTNAGQGIVLENRAWFTAPARQIVFYNNAPLIKRGGNTLVIPSNVTLNFQPGNANSSLRVEEGSVRIAGQSNAADPDLILIHGNFYVGPDASLRFDSVSQFNSIGPDATVVLDGRGSAFDQLDSISAMNGRLEILNGRGFFTNDDGFALGGSIRIGAGSTFEAFYGVNQMTGGASIEIDSSVAALPGRFLTRGPITVVGNAGAEATISTSPAELLPGAFDLGGREIDFHIGDGNFGNTLRVSAAMINGGVVKRGPGTMILEGPNAYGGRTIAEEGTLVANAPGTLPARTVLGLGFEATAVLNFDQSIEGLDNPFEGIGQVVLSSGSVLDLNVAGGHSYAGTIEGTGSLSKSGPGFQGIFGSYRALGPIRVFNGTLRLAFADNFNAGIVDDGILIQGGTLEFSQESSLPEVEDDGVSLAGGRLKYVGDTTFVNYSGRMTIGGGVIDVPTGKFFSLSGRVDHGNFTKAGQGTLALNRSAGRTTSTALVTLAPDGGTLELRGGTGEYPATFNIGDNATLYANRLDSAFGEGKPGNGPEATGTILNFNGGTFVVAGNSGTVVESVDQINVLSGASTIELQRFGGRVVLDSLNLGTVNPGATLNVRAAGLAASNAAPTQLLLGDNVPTGQLGSWFTHTNPSSGEVNFATYVNGLGVRPFVASDYSNELVRGANVRLTGSQTLPQSGASRFAIRSLVLVGATTLTIPTAGSVNVLDVTDGGIIKNGIGTASITGGTLTTANDSMNVFVAGGTLSISSVIGAAGDSFLFTKRGDGTLVLTGSANASANITTLAAGGFLDLNNLEGNAIPGNLRITAGTVRHLRNNQIGNLSDVVIDGGTFDLNGRSDTVRNVTNNAGAWRFGGGTVFANKVTLNGGTTTVGSTLQAESIDIAGGENLIESDGVVVIGSGGLNFAGTEDAAISVESGASSSGTIVLNGPITTNNAINSYSIQNVGFGPVRGRLDLNGASREFAVDRGAAEDDLLVSAQIVGNANSKIIKTGAGRLKLDQVNTYAGGTRIDEGVVEASAGALGSGVVEFTQITDLRAELNATVGFGTSTFGNALRATKPDARIWVDVTSDFNGNGTAVFGDTIAGDEFVVSGGDRALQIAGLSSLAPTLLIHPYADLRITGDITGSAAITIGSDTGPTWTEGGDGLPRNGSLGAIRTVTVGGTGETTNTATITVSSGSTVNLDRDNEGGTNGGNAVAGDLVINDATVRLLGNEQIADAADVTINTGGLLDLNGYNETINTLRFGGGRVTTGGGTLTLLNGSAFEGGSPAEGGTGAIFADGAAGSSIEGNVSLGGSNSILNIADSGAADDLLQTGVLNAAGLVKTGTGRLRLGGVNNITGQITLQQGELAADTPAALGTASLRLEGGTLMVSGSLNKSITLAGGELFVDSGQTLTLLGTLGGGPLIKTGEGTLTQSGNASMLTGGTTIRSGTIEVTSLGTSALGNAATNDIFIESGTLRLNLLGANHSSGRKIIVGDGAIDVSANTLTLSTAVAGVFDPISLSETGSLTKRGTGSLVLSVAPTFVGTTRVEAGLLQFAGGTPARIGASLVDGVWIVEGGSLQIAGGAISTNLADVSIIGSSSSFAGFNPTFNLGTIRIADDADLTLSSLGNGGLFVVGLESTLRVNGSLSSTGRIDLESGDMIIDYADDSPIMSIRSLIAAAFAGGTWDGGSGICNPYAGLDSRLAVGYAEAATLGLGTFSGQSVDATAIVIQLALAGDSDMNGTVGFEDLLALARNYSGSNRVWTEGDFDYDGTVGFADMLAVARNYNQSLLTADQTAALGDAFVADWTLANSVIPEPAALGVIAAAGVIGLRRRR